MGRTHRAIFPRGQPEIIHTVGQVMMDMFGRIGILTLFFCMLILSAQPVWAEPPVFARLSLNQSQTYRMMTVGTVETIDSMNTTLSRITLSSTSGDGSDMKSLAMPAIRNIRRIFSSPSGSWEGNILTILGPTDSTVSGTDYGRYDLFIQQNLPVIRCRIPDAGADVLLVKTNGTSGASDIGTLLNRTDLVYLLHTKGVIAIRSSNYTAYGGPWSQSDFDPANLSYTLSRNAIDVDDFTLNRSIAQLVSDQNPLFGTPPEAGEYLLAAFRYDPEGQRILTYATWPVIVLDGNKTLALSHPAQYDQDSGQDLQLTFTNTTAVSNVAYLLVKSGEMYDMELQVNMSALEELSDEFSLEAIFPGSPLQFLLKSPGMTSPHLARVIGVSMFSISNTTPPESRNSYQINITPGFGTSGFAGNSTQVNIPHEDLETLLPGTFSIYGIGLNSRNEITALDRSDLVIGRSPRANFSGTPTTGPAPLSVQFMDLSSGDPASWSWSFGDGQVSADRDPTHLFIAAGNYTVNLTVSNTFGSTMLSRDRYIVVTPPTPPGALSADFVASPRRGYYPLSVVFEDTSPGNPVSWNWSFGDGTNSSEQNPVHIYRRSGEYTVSLTVANATASDTLIRPSYITAIHQSGGGGGGGGGGGITVSTTANATAAATPTPAATPGFFGGLPIGPDNRTTQPVVIVSPDGLFSLSLASGVRVIGGGSVPVTDLNLSALPVGVLPPLPADPWIFTGHACLISPPGATFDPGVTFLLAFDEEQWEVLTGKGRPVLMWYDPAAGTWQTLETSVNEEARSVSTRITRGGTYGLFTTTPTAGPTVPGPTPSPTGAQAAGVTPPGSWFVPVLLILICIAAAAIAVYWWKFRPGNGKPPAEQDPLKKTEE